MKSLVALVTLALALAANSAPETRIAYFRHLRQVRAVPDRQNYATIDEAIWKFARTDLGDLRLYAGVREVPYALTVQQGSEAATQTNARLLNLGRVSGETQFVLDVAGVPDYNEVHLHLSEDAKDFVVRARVEGFEELTRSKGVDLGTSTLFDFSREKLGSNSTLKLLRPAVFRYLRVTLPQIAPEHVLGASVSDTRKRPFAWTPISLSPRVQQEGRATVITWDAAEQVPLARVSFVVDPQQRNFRRSVEIQNAEGLTLARREISRIHLVREGKTVDSECLQLDLGETRSTKFKVMIQNGDDPPLSIAQMNAFALERRLYFDPKGNSAFDLYYGDSSLTAPVYDYAKLLSVDDNAALASLGPDQRNAAYTGRPDERPWTDRHPAVLWTALVLAVLGLGVMAIKGLAATGHSGAE